MSCFSSDDDLQNLNEYKSIRNETINQLKEVFKENNIPENILSLVARIYNCEFILFQNKILEQNYPIEEIGNILLLPLNEEDIFKYLSYQCLEKSYSCLLYLLSCEHLEIRNILNAHIFDSLKSRRKTKNFNDNNFYMNSFFKFLRIVKEHFEKKST